MSGFADSNLRISALSQSFQFFVGTLGRHEADTEFSCENAHRGERIALFELSLQYQRLDLVCDLQIDRFAVGIADVDIHNKCTLLVGLRLSVHLQLR